MGLEVASTIDELNPEWPLGTDKVREGDDHLRLVKTAIQGTFPLLQGIVNATNLMLNELPEAGFSAFVVELLKHVIPTGSIQLWSGSIGSIPTGWVLCDGNNGTPDLRDRFVLGAGITAAGAIGGSLLTGASGDHTHTVGSHVLTVAEMPSHNHSLRSGARFVDTAGTNDGITGGAQAGHRNDGVLDVAETGGSAGHDHTLSSNGTHTHTQDYPPYYSLAYIMKTSVFSMPVLP